MKVSYVTIGNALDVHNWSGTEFYISQAIKNQGCEIDYIGNLSLRREMILKKAFYKIIGQRYDPIRDTYLAKYLSQQVKSSIKPNTDVIFSPGSVATALLETNKPKVVYSDATFANLIDHYILDLCAETVRKGNILEHCALESAKLIIYSSDWAAQSALNYYNVDPQKVKVVPFGANVEHNYSLNDIKYFIARRSKKECNLLFMGVDWERKGGDFAVKVTQKLNEAGLKTILHVVGPKKIPLRTLPSFLINHGFISKSTKEGKSKIISLIAKSHFLLLPTRAEAYGLVFCEANSLGLPSITTNVGGISTIIKNNINGMMFERSDKEEAYLKYIISMFDDYDKYKELAVSSFSEYTARLNWDIAGKSIKSLLKEL